MADIWFYQLQRQTLEQALPPLLEKSLQRGWKVVVQAGSDERVKALDSHLWTYREESFLPHGTMQDGDVELQSVYLTSGEDNPIDAQVRFFVDRAELAPAVTAAPDAYERTVLMFDGRDEDHLHSARQQWKQIRDSGLKAVYWAQNESGGWEQKG